MSKPENINEIERLLGDLSLREPSQILDERIAAMLQHEQNAAPSPRPMSGVLFKVVGVAAVVAIAGFAMVLFSLRDTSSVPDAHREVAERSEAGSDTNTQAQVNRPKTHLVSYGPQAVNLVWSRDVVEQMRIAPSGKPYRAIVRQTIDQRVWVNPETGESVQITAPREELYIAEEPVF